MSTWDQIAYETGIQDGPNVEEAVFNYVTVTDALNALAEKAGFWWKIDVNKKLYFGPRSTNVAPFAVDGSVMRNGSVDVERGNSKYRNRQYIKGGTDITDPQPETKSGDGEARSFVVGFPIAKVPTIEVSRNGAAYEPQTIGIKQVDSGKQWYWSKGDNTVLQAESEVVLAKDVDKVKVTYQGQFPIVAISEVVQEIDTRKATEGGTGIVEDVADEPQLTTRAAAFESANSKLEKYGVIGRKVKFQTWKPGLESGQLLTLTLPEHGIFGLEMLIESIEITKEDNMLWYTVTAVEGPVNGSWAKMFYAMATRGQAFVIRENISETDVLITLDSFSKTWIESERPNIFIERYPAATTFPGPDTFPMFAFSDRVKYLAWYINGVEAGRKIITKQTGEDTANIFSTTLLSPSDANGTLTHLGWFGGIEAADEVGSGILLDKQAYDKVKTNFEAIQIDKTDIKGW